MRKIVENPDGTYRTRLSTLDEIKASRPWYRRVWAFATDAHRFLVGFTAVCAFTIGAHAYLAGLITKSDLQNAVTGAVATALADNTTRTKVLEDRTAGLPDWRNGTQEKVTRHEERIDALQKQTDKIDTRVDRYLMTGRR